MLIVVVIVLLYRINFCFSWFPYKYIHKPDKSNPNGRSAYCDYRFMKKQLNSHKYFQ